MTKNVEVDISIKEILSIMRQHWKLLLILALICTVLGSGYGLHKARAIYNNVEPITNDQQVAYEKEVEDYALFLESQKNQPAILQSEWLDLYNDQKNNPIFTVDPYNCEYEQLVIRFADKGNYDKTIDNWIAEADKGRLFGDSGDKLTKYSNSLIFSGVDGNEYEAQYETDESVVQLIKVDSFNSSKAAEYISSYIKQKAEKSELVIQGVSVVHMSGYNVNVAEYQRKSRDAAISLYYALSGISNMKNVMNEPLQPQIASSSVVIKETSKYSLVGLIMGLILGISLALFPVLRKGSIISRRQIEEIFDLELLSDFSRRSEAAIEVLNANLDVISGDNSKIMLIGDSEEEAIAFVSKYCTEGGREFIVGYDIL